MKKYLLILISIFYIVIGLTSCSTTFGSTDDEYPNSSFDISIVLSNGTPYYYNNRLNYYLYNGVYYYPLFYNGYWYYRGYSRPFARGYYPRFNYRTGYRYVPRRNSFFRRRPYINYQRINRFTQKRRDYVNRVFGGRYNNRPRSNFNNGSRIFGGNHMHSPNGWHR